MKILYLEAQRKLNNQEYPINIDSSLLPKEIFLAYSIQYKKEAELIKKQLESQAQKIKIRGFQQVLGCTKLKVNPETPILLIGSGRFHALNLALQNSSPIYIYTNGSINKISETEILELKKIRQNNLNRFIMSKKIGIIISTKPGQENIKKSELLKEKISKKYPEKQVFFFISNHINLAEFENFSIDFWINSACPGLLNDSRKLSNIDDIISFL